MLKNGISVIIPTLNESEYLPASLDHLLNQQPPPDEVIVIDAFSRDGTPEIAAARKVQVLTSEASISKQMNLGAAHASGDLLLFLHADCKLEDNAFAEMKHCVQRNGVIGGAFKLQLCGNRPLLDLYLSRSGSWNARHSQTYLGDHAIFCLRSVFLEIGGFPDRQLMYEFEFMRKLRGRGNLIQLDKKCYASARRFQRSGYWKTIILMRALRTLYKMGLPTGWLEQAYQQNGDHQKL